MATASQLVFLHELGQFKSGTKVRFLCCVLEYDTTTGLLLVEHAYPADASQTPQAHVDMDLVIESAKSDVVEPGAWINVIGYVQPLPWQPQAPSSSTVSVTNKTKGTSSSRYPRVQAVLVWHAGPLKIAHYEESVEKHRVALSEARKALDRFSP